MTLKFVLNDTIFWFFRILEILIIVRIVLSWFPLRKTRGFVRKTAELVFILTEPVLAPFRKLLSKTSLSGPGMAFDFSPFLSCLAIEAVSALLRWLVLSL